MYLVLLQNRSPGNPSGYGIAVTEFGGSAQADALVIEDGETFLRPRAAGEIFAKLPIRGDYFQVANRQLRAIKLVKSIAPSHCLRSGLPVVAGTRGIAVNARSTGASYLEVLVCWNARFTSPTPHQFAPQGWTSVDAGAAPGPAPRPSKTVATVSSVPQPLAILIDCPGCKTRLRVRQVGPKALVHCPECRAAFFAEPAGNRLEIRFRAPVVRPAEDPRPAHEQLGLPPKAGPEEIKRAWRQRVKLYHPDNFHHLGEDFVLLATDHTRRINQAYEKLTG